jgi:hypothetical protein
MSSPLDAVELEGREAARWLIPLGRLLPQVPAVVLNERGVRRAIHGNELAPGDMERPPDLAESQADGADRPAVNPGRWRLLDGTGTLLGIAEMRLGGVLHPVIVLV